MYDSVYLLLVVTNWIISFFSNTQNSIILKVVPYPHPFYIAYHLPRETIPFPISSRFNTLLMLAYFHSFSLITLPTTSNNYYVSNFYIENNVVMCLMAFGRICELPNAVLN